MDHDTKVQPAPSLGRTLLGTILVLGGLWVAQKLSGGLPVLQNFAEARGVYMGSEYRDGRRFVALATPDRQLLVVEVDPRVSLRYAPALGGGARIRYQRRPEGGLLVKTDDLKPAISGIVVRLVKDVPGPWTVVQGRARNGVVTYPSDLSDGLYAQLGGTAVNNQVYAVEDPGP